MQLNKSEIISPFPSFSTPSFQSSPISSNGPSFLINSIMRPCPTLLEINNCDFIAHGENFMAIFTTFSVVIWFSTGTLGIFVTLV